MRRDEGPGIPAPPRERDRGESWDRGERCAYTAQVSWGQKQSRPHRQHATEYGSENNMWGRHMSGERGVWARGRIEASATHHRVYSSENNMIGTHIRGTQTSDVDLRTHEKS